jgi:pyruvate dehydrogenase E1 component
MYGRSEDIFYYLTLYNENYVQPPKPEGSDRGILEGLYRWSDSPEGVDHQASIIFSGSAQSGVRDAQAELADRWGIGVDLYSATSYKRLREDALEVERWNRLHPGSEPRVPYVTQTLSQAGGPIVAVTDYMKMVPDMVARWVPGRYVPLGTDGFGRSDTREALRRFFEIDAGHIVVATLAALAKDGTVDPDVVANAIQAYDIDPESGDPLYR